MRHQRTTYVCRTVSSHSATGPFLCAFQIPLRTFTHSQVPVPPSDASAPSQPNALRVAVASWNATRFPRPVALRIVEETYQRTIGHRITTSISTKRSPTQSTANSCHRLSLVSYTSPKRVPARSCSTSGSASDRSCCWSCCKAAVPRLMSS